MIQTPGYALVALAGIGLAAAVSHTSGCANSASDCALLGTCPTSTGSGGTGGSPSSSNTGATGGMPACSPDAPTACDDSDAITTDTCPVDACVHALVARWTPKRFGGTLDDEAATIGADLAGDLIVSGTFQGTLDLGGGPLVAVGTDLFVAQLDPAGVHMWSRSFAVTHHGTAVLPTGGVVITGSFQGMIDFGGGQMIANATELFVLRLDAAGGYVWAKQLGAAPVRSSVVVDASGNVILAGKFAGTIGLGGAPLMSAGGNDAFAAKLDPTGNHVWSKRFGGTADDEANAVAVGAAGDVFIAGAFKSATIDFPGADLVSGSGGEDAFVAKLSSTGAPVWARGYGDPGVTTSQRATGLALDASGNLFVAAEFDGKLDFGGKMPLVATKHAGALGKIDGSGAYLWDHMFDGADAIVIASVVTDASGNALLAGGFTGTISFDGDKSDLPLTSTGAEDAFLAKLGADGALRWSTAFGGSTVDAVRRATGVVAIGADLAAAGYYTGDLLVSGKKLPSTGGRDIFVARFGK